MLSAAANAAGSASAAAIACGRRPLEVVPVEPAQIVGVGTGNGQAGFKGIEGDEEKERRDAQRKCGSLEGG